MTMRMTAAVAIITERWNCPLSDDCDFSTDDIGEFTDHAGEYQHPNWPDNETGHAARPCNGQDEDNGDDEE